MDSSDSPLVRHLLTFWRRAWQPSRFIHVLAHFILFSAGANHPGAREPWWGSQPPRHSSQRRPAPVQPATPQRPPRPNHLRRPHPRDPPQLHRIPEKHVSLYLC